MNFLSSAAELDPAWFTLDEPDGGNIRVADELIVDLLFTANGETYASMMPFIREVTIEGVPVRVLNVDGLLRTKTDYREKDILDKQVLGRMKRQLER